MKKKYVVMFSVLIILSVVIYICIPKTKEEVEDKTKTNVNTNGFLTLMLEQDDGTYEKSSSSLWPEDGYIFNNVLSKCENGGELIWNNELKTITLKTDKTDKCYVYFDKYTDPTVNSITITDTTTLSISIRVSASGGTNSVTTYYYSINNGAYTSSISNTKTFTGLSKGTTYTIKVYVKDTNGVDSSVKTTSAETENLTYICTTGTNLATCIKNQYTSQGTNEIYYHTSSLANSAADNSYRYSGANPNNYVCFGSDASTCPNDNLYRIIGVFDNEIKLIKSTNYGDYAWDDGRAVVATSNVSSVKRQIFLKENGILAVPEMPVGGNIWSSSSIRIKLNTTYMNTFNSTRQNKIATHTWKVGGMEFNDTYTAKQYYNVEIGSSSNSTTDSIKIGLMYVSDYGFAVSNSYWTTALYNYDSALNSNWLYLGLDEWTIARVSSHSYYVFSVNSAGNISGNNYDNSSVAGSLAVRPSFYLISSTIYVSGSGTSSDPIRIN